VLVFDLDPGPPATIVECAEVAVRLREKFQNWGLQLFPKTSGSKGLQVYAPLNVPVTYELTKPLAKWIAQQLEKEMPQLVVSKMSKQLRVGKIFVDWSQNDQHKTTVCVYSLRAKDKPTVSTPLTWEEVEAVRKSRNPLDLQFETEQVLQRVEKMGDLFEPVLKLKQKFSKNVLAEMEKTS
jgi:bifunctional non-homologous end joining protein LigD